MSGGLHILGLGEETTEPQGDLPTVAEFGRAVDHYYARATLSFLGRCTPRVESVDVERRGVHLTLALLLPIRDPSPATLEGVREELDELSMYLIGRLDLPWLKLSAKLN